MRIAFVVLGDIARSPRTMYHALAAAECGFTVDLVGSVESPLPREIAACPHITIHNVDSRAPSKASADSRLRFLFRSTKRATTTSLRLAQILLRGLSRPEVIVVQNPPGVPVLAVAWVAARVRRARLVIDWHNTTHAMLALRLGARHWLVRLVKRHELLIGRRADTNLFVSLAMQQQLATHGVSGVVFRDYPADAFRPIPPDEIAAVRDELRHELSLNVDATYRLVVSATSWTADEDFTLLREAIALLRTRVDARIPGVSPFPSVVFLLTGQGAGRAAFEAATRDDTDASINVRTAWFTGERYPVVLASADVGVCVHRSTSGVDLPMKIADMFGAGLPVCALAYAPVLEELVHDGEDGVLFHNAGDLADALYSLFEPDGAARDRLSTLRQGVARRDDPSWQEHWSTEIAPLLSSAAGHLQRH